MLVARAHLFLFLVLRLFMLVPFVNECCPQQRVDRYDRHQVRPYTTVNVMNDESEAIADQQHQELTHLRTEKIIHHSSHLQKCKASLDVYHTLPPFVYMFSA